MKRCSWIWIVLIGIFAAMTAEASDFSVSSPDMKDGGRLPKQQVLNGFGCAGENQSPKLIWQNSPKSTESYAVTVYDPDAPTGSGWWHWVMFNIPGNTSFLEGNAGDEKTGRAPTGSIQSRTDFGSTGYGGACPPPGSGEHRYVFTVHALDTKKLELDKDSTAAMVGFYIGQHSLAKAEMMVKYSR